MKWGLVPGWHNGDPKSFPALLNNCRYEGMFDKPSYRIAINNRQRCVILADGFYEWKRNGKSKQPYYIYWSDHNPSSEAIQLTSMEEEKVNYHHLMKDNFGMCNSFYLTNKLFY
jgi:putative SOS response-associated peptidase YedK